MNFRGTIFSSNTSAFARIATADLRLEFEIYVMSSMNHTIGIIWSTLQGPYNKDYILLFTILYLYNLYSTTQYYINLVHYHPH